MCNFSPGENVLKLDESLIGEARKKVEIFFITASDHDKILRILSTTYRKQEVIAEELAIPARNVKSVNTLSEFESISCETRNISSVSDNIKGEYINKRRLLAKFVSKLLPHSMTQWISYLMENRIEAHDISLIDFIKWSQSISNMLSKVAIEKGNLPFKTEKSKKNEFKEEKQKINLEIPKQIHVAFAKIVSILLISVCLSRNQM